ncbi:hypothetical protein ATANTOWER_001228 [Ataeniobius toweri]|uniref:Uncharacterized protein n=1 Tax=Ataeniobius toweri TaxID=208326 RepID=A0ABU7A9X3_9TELE|nr:hypothetical protein [Ataeniobius toweri]
MLPPWCRVFDSAYTVHTTQGQVPIPISIDRTGRQAVENKYVSFYYPGFPQTVLPWAEGNLAHIQNHDYSQFFIFTNKVKVLQIKTLSFLGFSGLYSEFSDRKEREGVEDMLQTFQAQESTLFDVKLYS